MDDKIQKRDQIVGFHEGDIQLRETPEGSRVISGQAIVYERESDPIYGMYIEVIKRGALDEADMSRVVARTGHDDNNLLGTTMGGTLRLMNTAQALEYEVDIPDTTAGRDTAVYMQRRDITGSSFAFIEDESGTVWIDRSKDKLLPIKEIHKIRSLHDVSPVINPAYPDATSRLRSYDKWTQEKEDQEKRSIEEAERQKKIKADSDVLLAKHKQLNSNKR